MCAINLIVFLHFIWTTTEQMVMIVQYHVHRSRCDLANSESVNNVISLGIFILTFSSGVRKKEILVEPSIWDPFGNAIGLSGSRARYLYCLAIDSNAIWLGFADNSANLCVDRTMSSLVWLAACWNNPICLLYDPFYTTAYSDNCFVESGVASANSFSYVESDLIGVDTVFILSTSDPK